MQRLAQRAEVITYGQTPGATWQLYDVAHGIGEISFRLEGRGYVVEVTAPRPGVHIALDAAGAIAFLAELGHDPHKSAAGIAEFGGVRRRFETRARIGGVTVVDDYAHHPTEVGATISAGRLGGCRRVWAVFQPHRFTRVRDLREEFARSFYQADTVVVTDIYPAGETAIPGVDADDLAQAIEEHGHRDVMRVSRTTQVAGALHPRLVEGDLVITLGAGDITEVPEVLLDLLRAGAAGAQRA